MKPESFVEALATVIAFVDFVLAYVAGVGAPVHDKVLLSHFGDLTSRFIGTHLALRVMRPSYLSVRVRNGHSIDLT